MLNRGQNHVLFPMIYISASKSDAPLRKGVWNLAMVCRSKRRNELHAPFEFEFACLSGSVCGVDLFAFVAEVSENQKNAFIYKEEGRKQCFIKIYSFVSRFVFLCGLLEP